MNPYIIGSDAKTAELAKALIDKIQCAIDAENFEEAEKLISIGCNAVNRPFRAEFLALVGQFHGRTK